MLCKRLNAGTSTRAEQEDLAVCGNLLHEHNACYSRALLAFLTVYFDEEICTLDRKSVV